MFTEQEVLDLSEEWRKHPRWKGILRPYKAEEVVKLRGSIQIDFPFARIGATKLWELLQTSSIVRALGVVTGNQAVQQVQAGLKAIYISGWQSAADANDSGQTYPDLSLYPILSVPHLIKRIYNALQRADQIQHMYNEENIDWFVPVIADAEAGFGGTLNTFELIKAMIEAGAAAIHLEDQLSSIKKCGHLGGKVLIPTSAFIEKLVAARLAADIMGVPTLLIGRTDAESAGMILSDLDDADAHFLTGKRTSEGYFCLKNGIPFAIARGLAFAPYCDILWCETSKPDLGEAREFAHSIHEKFPKKWLAYNCSPSFNWSKHLDKNALEKFQDKLAEIGYKFQFVTLAGFHSINASMFELAHSYAKEGMPAYSRFQEHEFDLERKYGYKAARHQSFVGTGYFDEILTTITRGQTNMHALKGSTEKEQF